MSEARLSLGTSVKSANCPQAHSSSVPLLWSPSSLLFPSLPIPSLHSSVFIWGRQQWWALDIHPEAHMLTPQGTTLPLRSQLCSPKSSGGLWQAVEDSSAAEPNGHCH